MHLPSLTLVAIGFAAHSAAIQSGSITVLDEVTDNVLELTVHENPRQLSTPSTQHLARRRAEALRKRQIPPTAQTQESLIGIGGRIYLTNVTLDGQRFSLVIDTGSSDTWVATTGFQCLDPDTYATLPTAQCGFGPFYNRAASTTFKPINHDFDVDYAGGEFLEGTMGTERFGIGGVSQGQTPYVTINQTIGVVSDGYWAGDGISSGLMGLAYPALAEGVNSQELNYTSVMYTLLQNPSINPVFSLALNRATATSPRAGGYLAIGGIPNIANDGRWVQTPVTPYVQGIYAFYSINIDGFDITPPSVTSTTLAAVPTAARNPYSTSTQNMIIDSGSSLLYFPDAVSSYIASLFVPPARYNANLNTYLVPCTAAAPRVGVKIAGQTYYMSQDDLMNRGPGAVGGAAAGANPGECVLAVQNAQGGTLVLGDSWMKNVIVVFDVTNGTDYGPGGSDKNRNGGGSVRIVGREKY